MVAAQFATRLENYAEDLITQKNDFQVAIVMQIAVDVDKMGKWDILSDVLGFLTSDHRVDDIGRLS